MLNLQKLVCSTYKFNTINRFPTPILHTKPRFFTNNTPKSVLPTKYQSKQISTSFKNYQYEKEQSYHTNYNKDVFGLNFHLVGLLGIATGGVIAFSMGNLTGPVLDTPNEEEDPDLIPPSSPSPSLWKRISTQLGGMWETLVYIFNILSGHHEENRHILPDALPEPYGRPYTLFISLELLMEFNHQGGAGWNVLKRPGCDYFLQYLSRFYEIVIISSLTYNGTEAILDKIDPTKAIITYRLNRELLVPTRRGWIKPLHWMNRPMEKMILIDLDKEHCEPPDNVLVIPTWDGKNPDTTLLDLIPFLQELVIQNVKDVRPVLKAYDGKEIIASYRKARESATQKQESQKNKKGPSIWEKLK